MFFKGTRYAKVDTLEIIGKDGRTIKYKATRFIPKTEAQLAHKVQQGERLDHIAHYYFSDPERFWRICDANKAMWPNELISESGRKILIPSTEG